MGILDDLKKGASILRGKIEDFKANHTFAADVISKIISDLPSPFNTFGGLLWDNLEKDENSAQLVLDTLAKMQTENEIEFMKITVKLDEIIKKNPTKDDILGLSSQIRTSEGKIIDVLGAKIDQLLEQFNEFKETMLQLMKESKGDAIQKGVVPKANTELEIPIESDFLKKLEERDKQVQNLTTQLKNANQKPPFDIDYHIMEGNVYFYAKKYEKAIVIYDLILKVNPFESTTLYNKGAALCKLGKYQEAMKWLDNALKENPKNIDALYNMGNAISKLGNHQKAIEYYDKALEIQPNKIDVLNNKGLALAKLGKHQDAIDYFDKALEEDPRHLNSLYNKGLALAKLNRSQDAIYWYDKALEVDPTKTNAIYNKGTSLYFLGKYPEALVCFNKALESEPNAADILTAKKECEAKLKNISKVD